MSKNLHGVYIGPRLMLKHRAALLMAEGDKLLAQFDDMDTLPRELTHGWTAFERGDFLLDEDAPRFVFAQRANGLNDSWIKVDGCKITIEALNGRFFQYHVNGIRCDGAFIERCLSNAKDVIAVHDGVHEPGLPCRFYFRGNYFRGVFV